MSETNATRHPFLDDLTTDAELSGTVLRKPIKGRENIRRFVDTVGSLYATQTPTFLATVQGRTFLQYDATLHNGQTLQAVAVIEKGEDGAIPRVNVAMSPLGAALSLASRLGAALEKDFDGDHFL